MSSYLDTGSVLIESASEVERTNAALATLLSMVPGIHYYRCVRMRLCITGKVQEKLCWESEVAMKGWKGLGWMQPPTCTGC